MLTVTIIVPFWFWILVKAEQKSKHSLLVIMSEHEGPAVECHSNKLVFCLFFYFYYELWFGPLFSLTPITPTTVFYYSKVKLSLLHLIIPQIPQKLCEEFLPFLQVCNFLFTQPNNAQCRYNIVAHTQKWLQRALQQLIGFTSSLLFIVLRFHVWYFKA